MKKVNKSKNPTIKESRDILVVAPFEGAFRLKPSWGKGRTGPWFVGVR